MKNHLAPGELTLTRVAISSRFGVTVSSSAVSVVDLGVQPARGRHGLRGRGLRALKSTDAGATWNMVNVPLNTPFMKGYVRPEFLAMDPQNTSKIYFIGLAGGIVVLRQLRCRRHLDRHALYRPATHPSGCGFRGPGDLHLWRRLPTGNTLLYKSTDSGGSWTQTPPTQWTCGKPSGNQ